MCKERKRSLTPGVRFSSRSNSSHYSRSKSNGRKNNLNSVMSVNDINRTNELLSHFTFIKNEKVEVVFDTGATISVMSFNTAKKLGLEILPSNQRINTADGATNKVLGIIRPLEFSIKETLATISFVVTNVSHIEILLGLDWFEQTGVIIDPAKRVLTIPGSSIKLNPEADSNDPEENIYFIEDDIREDEIINVFGTNELILTENKELNKVLLKNQDVFSKNLNDLGCCDSIEFDIEITSEQNNITTF